MTVNFTMKPLPVAPQGTSKITRNIFFSLISAPTGPVFCVGPAVLAGIRLPTHGSMWSTETPMPRADSLRPLSIRLPVMSVTLLLYPVWVKSMSAQARLLKAPNMNLPPNLLLTGEMCPSSSFISKKFLNTVLSTSLSRTRIGPGTALPFR